MKLLRMETQSYRFLSFVNASIAVNKGVRKELTAMCLVALQNRMVLDQLTTAQGGACAIVGSSCSTYIPENDMDVGAIHAAIDRVTKVCDAVMIDETTETD